VLVRAGVIGALSAGIAALVVGFSAKSAVTAGPSDVGPGERPSVSVFGTIHPKVLNLPRPVGSQLPGNARVRLASLQVDVDAAAVEDEMPAATPGSTRHDASFNERFVTSFGAAREQGDESVLFGRPVSPQHLVGPSRAKLATLGAPARPPAGGVAQPAPTKPKAAPSAAGQIAPDAATAARAPLTTASRQPASEPTRRDSHSSPDADSRTAIYDISARTVYLPNGDRLEAHSGLGSHRDDPSSISLKHRGPTPPNVYQLALREQPFHGARAIRLLPVGEADMFGRDGILAHPYLLGPDGQSNGCVSFSDYPAFLNAFLRGEVDRLVVVERLASAPPPRAGSGWFGWLPEPIKNLFKAS
jgi:hypothetical protein